MREVFFGSHGCWVRPKIKKKGERADTIAAGGLVGKKGVSKTGRGMIEAKTQGHSALWTSTCGPQE